MYGLRGKKRMFATVPDLAKHYAMKDADDTLPAPLILDQSAIGGGGGCDDDDFGRRAGPRPAAAKRAGHNKKQLRYIAPKKKPTAVVVAGKDKPKPKVRSLPSLSLSTWSVLLCRIPSRSFVTAHSLAHSLAAPLLWFLPLVIVRLPLLLGLGLRGVQALSVLDQMRAEIENEKANAHLSHLISKPWYSTLDRMAAQTHLGSEIVSHRRENEDASSSSALCFSMTSSAAAPPNEISHRRSFLSPLRCGNVLLEHIGGLWFRRVELLTVSTPIRLALYSTPCPHRCPGTRQRIRGGFLIRRSPDTESGHVLTYMKAESQYIHVPIMKNDAGFAPLPPPRRFPHPRPVVGGRAAPDGWAVIRRCGHLRSQVLLARQGSTVRRL